MFRGAFRIPKSQNKKKAHFSIGQRNTPHINVPIIRKPGTNAQGEHCKNKLAYFYN
jgi:hypothetical protein